jgi:transformation/transcription domain-associated protein
VFLYCWPLFNHRSQGITSHDREEIFVRALEGLFDAIHLPEIGDRAEESVRKVSQNVFNSEIRGNQSKDVGLRRWPGPLLASYLDALPHAIARENATEALKAQEVLSTILQDLITMGNENGATPQDIIPALHQIASRFSSLCLDDTWLRKSAGCSGIRIMTNIPDIGVKWIVDHEIDLVRKIIHILKDLPFDLPHDVTDIVDVLTCVLRVCNAEADDENTPRNRLVQLIGIFFIELSSANQVVREAAQSCIDLLVTLSGRPAVDLLMPHRERMLAAIYTKPLRAVPFPIQIGMIEAVRYCVSLNPPLAEMNEELLRLLHETLALADADDLGPFSRGNIRQNGIEMIKLRVACIKLLTASMPITDFFSKQEQTRQRLDYFVLNTT